MRSSLGRKALPPSGGELRCLRRARSGQAEFLALLGLVIIGIVIAVLSLQPGLLAPPPAVAGPGQAAVKESVEVFIRSSAADSLRILGEQGGFATPQQPTVRFLGRDVPFWERAGQLSIPEPKQELQALLTRVLNENRAALAASFKENVSLGQASATASVRDTAIDIVVTMPTTMAGRSLPSQYALTLATNYGLLSRLGQDLARTQADQRYLERFLFASMVSSPYKGSVQEVPIWIFLTRCGDFVFKSSSDIQPELDATLRRTLDFTFLPGHAPDFREELAAQPRSRFGDEKIISNPSAALSAEPPALSLLTPAPRYIVPLSTAYVGVNATFHLPDGFTTPFSVQPDPVNMYAKPVPFTNVCQSDFVLMRYAIRFPAVVRLTDKSMALTFALDASIADNQPSEFGPIGPSLCANPQCIAAVQAIGVNNEPIPDAVISFLGCPLGTTDRNGIVTGPAPCGLGPLVAAAQGYSSAPQQLNTTDLLNAKAILLKNLNLRVHASEGFISNNTVSRRYQLESVSPLKDATARIVFQSLTRPGTSIVWEITSAESVQPLTADVYIASVSLLDAKNQQPLGAGIERLFINSSATDLYLTLPHPNSFPQPLLAPDLVQTTQVATILSSFLSNCNAGPISTIPPEVPCSKSYEEV